MKPATDLIRRPDGVTETAVPLTTPIYETTTFVFNNAERCDTMTGAGPAAIELAHTMSDAWVRFARTGNPNGGSLPTWPAFTPASGATMIFDNRCEVLNAPDAKEQAVIARAT